MFAIKIIVDNIELTGFNNCKLVRSNRIIVQIKMKHDAWQPIFNQPL